MTGRALLAPVSVRAAAAAAALLAASSLMVSCGDPEEEVGPDLQPSATVSPSFSASPVPLTATPAATSPTSEWKLYEDQVLSFSFDYPPELIPRDLTGPTSICCPSERVIDFRPTDSKTPGLAVSITDVDVGTSVREWASVNTGCILDSPPGDRDVSVAGRPALTCIAEPMDDQFENGADVLDGKHMTYITGTISGADFQRVLQSLRFPGQ